MSYAFGATMFVHPPHQKHASPKLSDNFGFLSSLKLNACADCNLTWVWNNLKKRTKDGGGSAFGLHWPDPIRNGYRWILDKITGRVRRMTHAELHRTAWTVSQVLRWRRGPSKNSARPRKYSELVAYVKKHGGTIVAELKSQAFAIGWVMEQLVATAKRHGHAPWFKALANMRKAAGKCAATVRAGGQFALIFGDHIRGRGARMAAGHKITATWAVPPTRIW
jgi:hypothetical protein